MSNSNFVLPPEGRVAERLCRYSTTKQHYVVFKFGGKTKWILALQPSGYLRLSKSQCHPSNVSPKLGTANAKSGYDE
jgi:hypothetical protein